MSVDPGNASRSLLTLLLLFDDPPYLPQGFLLAKRAQEFGLPVQAAARVRPRSLGRQLGEACPAHLVVEGVVARACDRDVQHIGGSVDPRLDHELAARVEPAAVSSMISRAVCPLRSRD